MPFVAIGKKAWAKKNQLGGELGLLLMLNEFFFFFLVDKAQENFQFFPNVSRPYS